MLHQRKLYICIYVLRLTVSYFPASISLRCSFFFGGGGGGGRVACVPTTFQVLNKFKISALQNVTLWVLVFMYIKHTIPWSQDYKNIGKATELPATFHFSFSEVRELLYPNLN